MHTLAPPAKIFVTGANGFVGVHVIETLLNRGFYVRGSVRSADKAAYLRGMFHKYGKRFEAVIVPDVLKPGAYDEAVVGVDGVAHVGTALARVTSDPNEVIKPAVEGLRSLFESVRQFAPQVKRIVLTSSTATVMMPGDGPHTCTEANWNEHSVKAVQELGAKADPITVYLAVKCLQERAAWDYVSSHTASGSISFDLVTILPGTIFGPPHGQLDNVSQAGSSGLVWQAVQYDGKARVGDPDAPFWAAMDHFVDVRDVADMHAKAFEVEAAGGERILSVAGNLNWHDTFEGIKREYNLPGIPATGPDQATQATYKDIPKYDNSKTERILGHKYRTPEETVKDTYLEFVNRGWLE